LEGFAKEDVATFYAHLVYIKSIWYIFGHLVYFMAIWKKSPFGMLYQEKSSNPAPQAWTTPLSSSIFFILFELC
jgi:hypothetical protein